MKYKVIESFNDKHKPWIRYEEGKTYEFTDARAKEILSKKELIKLVKTSKPKKGVVE